MQLLGHPFELHIDDHKSLSWQRLFSTLVICLVVTATIFMAAVSNINFDAENSGIAQTIYSVAPFSGFVASWPLYSAMCYRNRALKLRYCLVYAVGCAMGCWFGLGATFAINLL